jgi:Phage terminase, small subunit
MPKPPITVLRTSLEASGSDPPASLGPHGHKLWASIMAQYGIADAGGLAILAEACRAADMAEEYSAIIARDGPTQRSPSGVLRDHPLTRHVLSARALAARLLVRLGLNFEAVKPMGRPSGEFTGVSFNDLPRD